MPVPLVSVIVCVRNGEKYLREALDSIAGQGFEDMEVIVVDDGSNDDSVQIAKNHPLLPKIVSQEPLGLGAALNHGIHIARGRFLAFLDCDDVWPSGRLETMLAVFKYNPDKDCIFGRTVNTNEHLEQIGPPLPARVFGAMLIKRESFLKIGELRTDVAHGVVVDWHSRATLMSLKFHGLDDVLLLRRIHDDNMGIRDRRRAKADLLRIIRDHQTRKRQ